MAARTAVAWPGARALPVSVPAPAAGQGRHARWRTAPTVGQAPCRAAAAALLPPLHCCRCDTVGSIRCTERGRAGAWLTTARQTVYCIPLLTPPSPNKQCISKPDCSASVGGGRCAVDGRRCVCVPDRTGADCSIPLQEDMWAVVGLDGHVAPRAGHASAADEFAGEVLWSFGGYAGGTPLGDLVALNLTSRAWDTPATNAGPVRFPHGH